MKKGLFLLFLLFLFIILSCNTQNGQNGNEEIKLGLFLPLLSFPDVSDAANKAAELAATEINNAGGINGKKIKFVIANTSSDTNELQQGFFQLADIEKATVIIGPYASSSLMKISDLIKERNIPVISPAATADEIRALNDNNCIWRTVFNMSLETEVLAKYITGKRNKKTISVFSADHPGVATMRKTFISAITDNGGSIVSDVVYPGMMDYSSYNFTPDLEALFGEKSEAVFFLSGLYDASYIFTAIGNNEEKYYSEKPLFFGMETLFSQTFLTNTPDIVNNTIILTSGNRESQNFLIFKEAFEKHFGSLAALSNSLYIEQTYDAIILAALAIAEGKSTDPESIKAHLLSVSKSGEKIKIGEFAKAKQLIEAGADIDYDGVSGPVDFDVNGDVISAPFTVYEVQNKVFVKKEVL